MEAWWKPGGSLVEPWWNLASGPPRTTPEPIWAETPHCFQLLGKKQVVPGVPLGQRSKGVGSGSWDLRPPIACISTPRYELLWSPEGPKSLTFRMNGVFSPVFFFFCVCVCVFVFLCFLRKRVASPFLGLPLSWPTTTPKKPAARAREASADLRRRHEAAEGEDHGARGAACAADRIGGGFVRSHLSFA